MCEEVETLSTGQERWKTRTAQRKKEKKKCTHLERGYGQLAMYGLWAKYGRSSTSANKVLLEHKNDHILFTYYVSLDAQLLKQHS